MLCLHCSRGRPMLTHTSKHSFASDSVYCSLEVTMVVSYSTVTRFLVMSRVVTICLSYFCIWCGWIKHERVTMHTENKSMSPNTGHPYLCALEIGVIKCYITLPSFFTFLIIRYTVIPAHLDHYQ